MFRKCMRSCYTGFIAKLYELAPRKFLLLSSTLPALLQQNLQQFPATSFTSIMILGPTGTRPPTFLVVRL